VDLQSPSIDYSRRTILDRQASDGRHVRRLVERIDELERLVAALEEDRAILQRQVESLRRRCALPAASEVEPER
jgi:hypothetical protein